MSDSRKRSVSFDDADVPKINPEDIVVKVVAPEEWRFDYGGVTYSYTPGMWDREGHADRALTLLWRGGLSPVKMAQTLGFYKSGKYQSSNAPSIGAIAGRITRLKLREKYTVIRSGRAASANLTKVSKPILTRPQPTVQKKVPTVQKKVDEPVSKPAPVSALVRDKIETSQAIRPAGVPEWLDPVDPYFDNDRRICKRTEETPEIRNRWRRCTAIAVGYCCKHKPPSPDESAALERARKRAEAQTAQEAGAPAP